MRGKSITCLALSFLIGTGCQRQCFLSESAFHDANGMGIPANLACDPMLSVVPGSGSTPAPTTVFDTTREVRYLSLREAIAIALENGTVGSQNAVAPGFANDTLVSFAGNVVAGSDSIRVLSVDPAIVATNIEASLAKFDARWTSNLTWNRAEGPAGLPGIGAALPPQGSVTNSADFNTTIEKPLPTGGVAGITFRTDYQQPGIAPGINPTYQPALQFSLEQPLLQGFGVEINQLRESHPGSILNPFNNSSRVEGVLITRLRLDEQRTEFERRVHFLLLNVEAAYWNLYGAYYQLYSQEEGMRQAYEVWRTNDTRFQNGTTGLEDLAQSRLQYEQFRSQRLTALNQVLENERQLRGLMGLHIDDGKRVVPADAPVLAPFKPDWDSALCEALARRPELQLARQDLKFRQLDLIRVKDNLLPDLRAFATYDLHSIGNRLDGGPNGNNAFHDLVSDPFVNASVGVRMDVPLGFRDANAAVRAARLSLERSYMVLRTEETRSERFLALYFRQISEFQAVIQAQQAAVDAAHIQEEIRFRQWNVGASKPGTDALLSLLIAQRDQAVAVAGLYNSITQYNIALIGFEFAKGSILEHDNVFISDGPLPNCAQVRAVEHEKQRTEALVLKERQHPVFYPACSVDPAQANAGLAQLPSDTAVSLPALLEARPAVPEVAAAAQPQRPRPGTAN